MRYAEWRRVRAKTITLPSGFDVTIKPGLRLVNLAAQMVGSDLRQLPAPLAGYLQRAIDGQGANETLDLASLDVQERIVFTNAFARAVARAALLDPKVFDEREFAGLGSEGRERYGETHIHIEELELDDCLTILQEASQEAQSLIPFRPDDRADGDPGRDGQEVRAESGGDVDGVPAGDVDHVPV